VKTISKEMDKQNWEAFEKINNSRRAVKHFTGEAIADEDMKAILAAAQSAPSSFNLQQYELHWVRDKSVCKQMATACKDQRAAASAAAFVVVVAKWRGKIDHYDLFLKYVDSSNLYDEKSKAYHHGGRKKVAWFLRLMPLWIFGGLRIITSFFNSHLTLLPIGPAGLHHWAARNSIFAAQTLLLAASARGIDTCPMEGFSPSRVAKILAIKRGVVIPLVIALGKRNVNEPLTPHWRLPYDKVVAVH
jgi:nitroreductase